MATATRRWPSARSRATASGAVSPSSPTAGRAAVFRDAEGEVYAVGNRDPFSGADVLADGITGTVGNRPVITSPMHKQTFDLGTASVRTAEPTPPGSYSRGGRERDAKRVKRKHAHSSAGSAGRRPGGA